MRDSVYPIRDSISDSAALLELSNIINGSQDLDFILGNILLTSMGKLMISRGCVFLRQHADVYRLNTCKGVKVDGEPVEYAIPFISSSHFDMLKEHTQTEELGESFRSYCRSNDLRYVVPMILRNEVEGLLLLGPKLQSPELDEQEVLLLESIAAIAATAVGNATLIEQLRVANRSLDAKIQEQQTLYEVSREMNATFEEDAIYRLLGYALMGQMRIIRYALIVDSDSGYNAPIVKLKHFEMNQDACKELMGIDGPHRIDDGDELTDAEKWMRNAGVDILIPMASQNNVIGLLCLGERMGSSGYEASDIEYLQALANRTIVAMENARMVGEILEKQRLEEQIQVARTIQKELLPRTIPATPGYEICAENMPSQSVGGDYYDIVQLSGGRTLIAIADVSGKGIPASLLMANIQAGLRTLAPIDITLEEATSRLNTLIHENTSPDKFITFFWGILDTATNVFRYVNAGHNPPLLIHNDGTFQELDRGGVILGVLGTPPPYEFGEVVIHSSDMLVLYTDGFNEAMSIANEELGEERMITLLTKQPYVSAKECMEDIMNEIFTFTAGAAQSDDITLITLHRA